MVNLEVQDDGSADTTQRRTLSKSRLARSAWPLVCGWYPEDRLAVAPSCRQNSVQNFDTNWGLLSETTSTGRPWMRKTWSKTIVAVSLAEGNLGRGIKWVAFENLSTTVSHRKEASQLRNPSLCVTSVAKPPTAAGVALLGDDWSPYPQHKWDRSTRTVERPSPWMATKTAAWLTYEYE